MCPGGSCRFVSPRPNTTLLFIKVKGCQQKYFRHQIYACFWFERKSFRAALDMIAPDNIMFDTDFPHPTCRYPNALEQVAKTLEGLDLDTKRKLPGANASLVYMIPV